MDIVNNECATDILVDIKEDEKFVSYISGYETKGLLKVEESKTKMTCSSGENGAFSSESCPTGILVDVPPPLSSFCLCDNCESSNAQNLKEDQLNGCNILNKKNPVSNEKLDITSINANTCKAGDSYISSTSNEGQSEISVKRLRWKTPSPQSMNRISKEASKVIDHLNSSMFEDDLLLTDEMLPVSLNFDELDDSDQENPCDIVFEDAILKYESSVNVQFLNKIEKKDVKLSYPSFPFSKGTSEKNQCSLEKAFVERDLTKTSFRFSSKIISASNESCSSGVLSSSHSNSDSLSYCDEDDVFNVTHIASEDKENKQIKMNKLVLTKENKIGSKTATKNLSVKLDQRSTLRNLSNIKQQSSFKRLSVTKSLSTPLKKMNISMDKKETAPKPQLKKPTSSVGSHYSLKNTFRPNSFQNKELISSIQKPQPTIKINSGCSSLSSDVKQHFFATPSKRYSLCPPLKSASAIKAPLTPAMTNVHNFAFPRYTPQPLRPSRLSLSRSWQHSGDNSQCFGAKGLKPRISATGLSSTSKVASGIKNSSRPGKLSFSQSMSAVPVQSVGKNKSTSSKIRFSSKLNLPSSLTVDQNKNVVRALFTSVPERL